MKLGFVRLCKCKRVHWPRERRCLNETRQNKRLWRSRDYEVADERSRKTGTDPACLDPREWLPVLSLGGPWGAEGCCQLGWTAQDLPPHAIHNHLHPQPRSPPLARRISGAIQPSPSTSLFASKQLDAHYRKNHPPLPFRISLTVTMTTRKTTRCQGSARAGYYHVNEYLSRLRFQGVLCSNIPRLTFKCILVAFRPRS